MKKTNTKMRTLLQKIKGKMNILFGPEYFIRKGNIFLNTYQYNEAEKVFKKGLTFYRNNYKLNSELMRVAMIKKEWKNVIKLGEVILTNSKINVTSDIYLNLSNAYQKEDKLEEAENILSKGIKALPKDKKISDAFVNIAVFKKNWYDAITRLEEICRLHEPKTLMNIYIKLSMIYQIIGAKDKANNLFNFTLDTFKERINKDKKGYRKIIVFDNGESRIEFYKKLQETQKVIVTFDSINMIWRNPSFAFKLLSEQNLDIIAVRKRKKRTYQQDLSQRDFYKSVHKLVSNYEDKIAYGFSLGAYATLYFASILNCRILSIAPRLSIHPIYGRKNFKSKFEFKHNLTFPPNAEISPIIVYDPKNKLDHTYVTQEILKSFPNATLVNIPYGGHGMAPHLLKMELLKKFLTTVINSDDVPKYDRKLRSKSSIYYRLLGSACLKHNKLRWANDLADRSLKLLPTDKLTIKLKVNVLKSLKEYKNATYFTKEAKVLLPNAIDIRLLLIDLYIETEELFNAEKEITNAIEKFGRKNILKNRLNKLDKMKKSALKTI